ncbi:MAG: lysophospholipid acyltransferase family protein [Bacilli bacterium]
MSKNKELELQQKKQYREKIASLIIEKERRGGEAFFEDVEEDSPSKSIEPDQVDYLQKKFSTKVKASIAEMFVSLLYKKVKKENEFKIVGEENLKGLKSGAIITGNHFHYFESAGAIAVRNLLKGKKLFRVVKEGNFYMKGFFGFLLKNASTLPLSSNMKTMMKFNKAVDTILKNGDLILVYPEQAMWWNYRKPRPHRVGASHYAAKNNVPMISYFITMEDSDRKDELGEPIQKYTCHILPLIYPDPSKSIKENEEEMTRINYEAWVKVYEETYHKKLTYLCDEVDKK